MCHTLVSSIPFTARPYLTQGGPRGARRKPPDAYTQRHEVGEQRHEVGELAIARTTAHPWLSSGTISQAPEAGPMMCKAIFRV